MADNRLRRDTRTPADTAELPTVPGSDAAAFLNEAAAALSHADYTRVAAVYHQAVETTDYRLTRCGTALDLPQRMLAYLPAPRSHLRTFYGTIPHGRALHRHAAVGLYRFLGDLVADSPGRNHTLTRLRGAQAAFEQHGLPLTLPPNLAYMVGPGLTTIAITDRVVTRLRANAANPAHAVALATLLFTGATFDELRSFPRLALIEDTLIAVGASAVPRPTELCLWVIPPPARPLLHAAVFQRTRTNSTGALFAEAVGRTGRLRRTAATCGLTIPALHRWRDGWLRRTGILNLVLDAP
ncbi:hypothetical protein [Rhodococcus sp. DMU1]|uniref:hypothetical protein n=1 Tax=Rhodococcus sp. DMU1 TaxID=2722825 RepID=UPI00143E3907|nr:hypothetical protein [Rhodococcus sp. DMU1]QIX53970.1 hypothetical protein HFP48_31005 [Rhodococcus sp. DMU1]